MPVRQAALSAPRNPVDPSVIDACRPSVTVRDQRSLLITRRAVKTSAIRPVPILQAPAKEIVSLLLKALPAPDGAIVVPFPRFARSLHAFADYRARFPKCDLASEPIDGLGLAGAEKWVRSLTGSLKLLR